MAEEIHHTHPINPISPIAFANNIISAGKLCATSGATVGISSIFPRADFHLQIKRAEVNLLLRALCEVNNFHFIDQSNIVLSDHILNDGVHLNKTGTNLFSGNIIDFLNKMCS